VVPLSNFKGKLRKNGDMSRPANPHGVSNWKQKLPRTEGGIRVYAYYGSMTMPDYKAMMARIRAMHTGHTLC